MLDKLLSGGQTDIERATDFLTALNVSGPRESQRPGVYAAAMRCLEALLRQESLMI